jgi:dipeptidyl aminopeptidase/acylaminoacyl peptidase
VATGTRTCVEMLKGHTQSGAEDGYHDISKAEFEDGNKDLVLVTPMNSDLALGATMLYAHREGTWQVTERAQADADARHNGLSITVKEGLNQPPLLVAATSNASRVLWDPNPQLKNISLGEVSIFRWKDGKGREMEGDLYKPANYHPGERYPLVILTHGNYADQFRPSGLFTTAFGAQELASTGIAVLQVLENCIGGAENPDEGPCAVSVYESAVDRLAAEGLVDREKVGIIGFSHTCFYVMFALTMNSTLHLRAASVNDGYMNDYLQFMAEPSPGKSEPWNGAAPFGEGLQLWLKRSPSFNLDKIDAPLLMMSGTGGQGSGGLFMWGPYAGLYSLKKPVDLILLNTSEHGITNPAVRMVSQGTNVDWFRFWLQGYEDPDPARAEQYKRWRQLRDLQAASDKNISAMRGVEN